MICSMPAIQGSANYIWLPSCALGKGATGAVYQGVHKTTGEPVAVKTFNRASHMRPYEVQMREFELLKKVNHENVVRLLAVEEEVESHNKVLIMELCTGGSLYNILDDPENTYGLEEPEFLLVLKHLAGGMKHLRDNHIIHRDLKPGNIMKYVAEDGQITYKLTDFGAARELEDDQQFMSLYGTEEYLHPDMYERAILRKAAGKSFRATVDLWSIGVTLYHVATGCLPFRPYGGRKNSETMHYITTEKASGVISGVQHTENGPIEWSRELPKTCLLSQGLQELFTPLLAGLLECDEKKMWSFDCFFNSVTNILNRTVVHVFYVNEGSEVALYLTQDKTLLDLQEQIAMYTEVPHSNQFLMFENSLLEQIVGSTLTVSSFPETSLKNPLILIHKENMQVKLRTGLITLSARFPMFPTKSVNLEHDSSLAKVCCSVSYAIKRMVERLVRCHTFMMQVSKWLLSLLQEDIHTLSQQYHHTALHAECLDQQLKFLSNSEHSYKELVDILPFLHHAEDTKKLSSLIHHVQESRIKVNQHMTVLQTGVKSLEQKMLTQQLQQMWEQTISDCISLSGCTERVKSFVQKIRTSWQALLRDKAAGNLSYNDEQFHILEKIKIQQTCQKLLSLSQEQCLMACHQVADKLDEWYSCAQVLTVQASCLRKELAVCDIMVQSHGLCLKELQENLEAAMTRIITMLKVSLPKECPTDYEGGLAVNLMISGEGNHRETQVEQKDFPAKRQIHQKLLKELADLKDTQANIWNIIEENNIVIEQFKSLSEQVMHIRVEDETAVTPCVNS